MQNVQAFRAARHDRLAYKAQLMTDNLELLAAYAECLDLTCEDLLQKMHPRERDLTSEDFADYLSNRAEQLAA